MCEPQESEATDDIGLSELQFTVADEDLSLLADDGSEEQEPAGSPYSTDTQQPDKQETTAASAPAAPAAPAAAVPQLSDQATELESTKSGDHPEGKASKGAASDDHEQPAAKKRRFTPITLGGFFNSSEPQPSDISKYNDVRQPGDAHLGTESIRPPGEECIRAPGEEYIRPPGEEYIRPPGEECIRPPGEECIRPPGEECIRPPGEEYIATTVLHSNEYTMSNQQQQGAQALDSMGAEWLAPPGEANPSSSSCLQELARPVCTIAPQVSKRAASSPPSTKRKHASVTAPPAYFGIPTYPSLAPNAAVVQACMPSAVPNYDYHQQMASFNSYVNPMQAPPQQCFMPPPNHSNMYCPPQMFPEPVPVQQYQHHMPMPLQAAIPAVVPSMAQFIPPSPTVVSAAPSYGPPTQSFPQPNTQGPFFPSSCQSSVGPPRPNINLPVPPAPANKEVPVAVASAVKEWKDNFKHLGHFSNIFKYLYQTELKKLLLMFGTIKYFSYICNTKDSHGRCEASFSSRPSLLRAVRLMPKLTIEGSKIIARLDVRTALPPLLSDNDKSIDIECMMKITTFLKEINRAFNWENDPVAARRRTTVKNASKAASFKTKDSTNRQNLITIRLGTVKSTPESAANKEQLLNLPMGGQSHASLNPAPSHPSSLQQSANKTDNKIILKSIQTITKKINERKERINATMDQLYTDDTLVVQPSNRQTLNVTLSAGDFASLAVTALKQLERLFEVRLINVSGVFEVRDAETAFVMKHLLHNSRLLDTRLSVTLIGLLPEDHEPSDYSATVRRYGSAVGKAIDANNVWTMNRLSKRLRLDVDLYTFRVNKCSGCKDECSICSGACVSPQRHCPGYHNAADRRRDIKQYTYRSKFCPDFPRCESGIKCVYSHTELELLMHPDNFRRTICRGWTTVYKCPRKNGVCFDAHPESPEMFYRSDWKDLYVTGLHNTINYVVGAIRCLYMLTIHTGLMVLLVSPHASVVSAVAAVLEETAATHGVKLATVLSGKETIDGAQVVLGTLEALTTLVRSGGSAVFSTLRSLIIDDITSLFEKRELITSFMHLISSIYANFSNTERLQKVVVAHEVHIDEVAGAKTLLGSDFVVVKQNKERNSTKEKDSASRDRLSSQQRLISVESSNEDRSRMGAADNFGSRSVIEKKTVGSKDSRDGKLVRVSHSSREQRTRESSPKHTREHSISSASLKNIRVEKQSRRARSPTNIGEQNVRQRHRDAASSSQPSQKAKKMSAAQQFLEDEKKLRKDHEDEYTVYLDMPEMHGDYEEILEDFTKVYNRQPSEDDDEPWKNFWIVALQFRKEKEWKDKRNGLITKSKAASLQGKQLSKNLSDSVDVVIHGNHSSDDKNNNFDVDDACNSLIEQVDGLGMLGPPMLRLLRMVHDAGNATIEACNIILNESNATLLNMCSGKFNALSKSTRSQYEMAQLKKASVTAHGLLDYAKTEYKNWELTRKLLFELDVKAIAKSTLGKSPAEITKILKTSLKCENNNYISNEELSDVFLRISSQHFKDTLSRGTVNGSSTNYDVSVKGGTFNSQMESVITLDGDSSGSESSYTSDSGQATYSWFIGQVRNIMNNNSTVDEFNNNLSAVLTKRPANYRFSSQDLMLASELQQLTNLNLSESLFMFAVKEILSKIPST